jgi:hypothetical protein
MDNKTNHLELSFKLILFTSFQFLSIKDGLNPLSEYVKWPLKIFETSKTEPILTLESIRIFIRSKGILWFVMASNACSAHHLSGEGDLDSVLICLSRSKILSLFVFLLTVALKMTPINATKGPRIAIHLEMSVPQYYVIY